MKKDIFSFEQINEFDNHQMVIFFYRNNLGLKGYIAIHRNGTDLPAFGATRIWYYKNDLDALKETLRLSKLMSYKSVMAGLPYGGAKATINLTDGILTNTDKKTLLIEYVKQVNYLNGKFITGADVGVNENDVKIMREHSPYIVGVKYDAVKYTALGVYYGIQASLEQIYGNESIEKRTFAIQGLGKTGYSLLKLLYDKAALIYVSDINHELVKNVKKQFPKIKTLEPTRIYKQKVDVFSPCALSNAVNLRNISSLQCKIIAGCANLQLESTQIGALLHKLDILFAPDFIINSGGLISVADEYAHKKNDEKRVHDKVKNIKNTLKNLYTISKAQNKPTSQTANEMAEEKLNTINGYN